MQDVTSVKELRERIELLETVIRLLAHELYDDKGHHKTKEGNSDKTKYMM